jgi:hypothetical protein
LRHGAKTIRRGAPGLVASLAARLGLLLTVVALLAQSLAFAAPPHESPRGAAAAAAELSALLGSGVVICTQSDDPDAPAPPPHGCDQCPLCRLAAGALTLDLPAAIELAAPAPARASKLALPQPPRQRAPARPPAPLPRGPPSPT